MATLGPTRRHHRTAIERWLLAGAPEALDPELESAWAGLLAELPDEAPSTAFTSQVMLRVAGLRAPHAARDLPRRLRLALVACFGLIAVSALLMPALLLDVPLQLSGLVDALLIAVKGGLVWAASGIAVWRILAEVGRTASVVLATPQATAFVASFALLAAGALRLLVELTRQDRRTADAAAR